MSVRAGKPAYKQFGAHSVILQRIVKYQASRAQSGHKPFELYSQGLIQTLRELCPGWIGGQCYRIYGEVIPGKSLIRFHLRDSSPLVQ